MNPKAPAGVVRSPSRLCLDVPRCPSQAVHGPATGSQHSPGLRHSRSAPCVDVRWDAVTVTSSRAAPVEASWFARFAAHELLRPPAPAAEAARQSGTATASAIHLIVRADYVPMRLVLLALVALQPPFAHAVSHVTAAQLPHSWHPGCPVAPARLRPAGRPLRGVRGARRSRGPL